MITPLEKVPFFSDWLSAVSVGYQLEQLQGISSAALNDLEAESVYEAIERIVDLWSLYTGQNSVRELMCLPLVTIQQLAKINHPSLEKVSSTAIAARDLLLRREKDGSSLVLKAKLVLDRLISGTHTPLQAIGLLKAELGVSVKRDVAHLEALDLFMQEASRPNPQLLTQVMALDRLGALVGRGRGHWRLLENCLLQASFTWPLFVIDTGQDNSHQVVGTSLPFLIELKIPEKALKGNGQQKVAILGDSDADFGARLRATAETALSAATGAWQNQNSDWFLDFHDRLNSADGIVDIRYAQKVRELAGYDPKLPIAGRSLRSMEAHLALKFFGALADPHGMDYTCATGALRPRRGFIDKSDFEVSPTSGTIGKLERATLAASFDRVCVPNERGSTDLIKVNVPANLSIVRGKYFSDFAQSVFPADFSRNTFIRCPDLAQAWNSDIPCYFVDSSEVESARQAIHGANEPVLVLDRSHSPAAVARALYLDNADHERNADLIRNSTGYKDLVRNEDFLQSFAFIRAVDYETNERFWRVVWELLSGRDMEWDRFCFPVSTVQPAKMLAQLLNRTYSTQARPRRVPDKIVIVGSDYLSRKIVGCPTGPFARLQMRSLLPELNANIGQIKPSYITENLGMARIILVPEDSKKTAGAISILEIPEAFRSSVRKLVILQYGFSFAVAKTHLGMDDWDAAMELRRMLGFAVGGVPLLSKIRGTMFAFNFTVNIEALPVIEKARAHVKVARSLLGLAGGSVDMGHADFRRSLSAVSVHEAEFHLATALRVLQVDVNGNGPLWNEATDLRIRINRLSEPFSWTRVRFAASQKGKDDESLIEVGLEHINRWKGLVHPIEIVLLLRLVWSFLRRIRDDRGQVRKADELRLLIKSLLERAYISSGKIADKVEQAACDFFIASSYCTLSLRDNPTMENVRMLKHNLTIADQNQEAMLEVADLSWFVLRGDLEAYHEDAAQVYFRGYFDRGLDGLEERRPTEALVKFLGANEWAKKPHEEEWKLAVFDLTPRRVAYVIKNGEPLVGIGDSNWSTKRWKVGRIVVANWLSEKFECEGDLEVDRNERLKKYLEGALIMKRLEDAPEAKWGDGVWRCLVKYVELARSLKMPFSPEVRTVMGELSDIGRDALVRNFAKDNI